jgi:hypothetical protein
VVREPHGKCVSVRGAAARLWTLLDRGASLRTIGNLLRREYGLPPGLLETELAAILKQLLDVGLIKVME